jgi:hypothetical protein
MGSVAARYEPEIRLDASVRGLELRGTMKRRDPAAVVEGYRDLRSSCQTMVYWSTRVGCHR